MVQLKVLCSTVIPVDLNLTVGFAKVKTLGK